ncbi:MAG: hypothetical protein N2Z20_01120 [Elusimicrobiales bacterium]|nr:hypothetical protein [Elusimicrobiales bacterium]
MNKGNYYKKKTKEFLEKQGFVCEYLEKLQRIYDKGKIIFVKRDIFASDILAVNKEKIIFVQVKSGSKNTGINYKKAIDEFLKYPFPEFVDRWIIIWKERQKEPQIIDIKEVIKK